MSKEIITTDISDFGFRERALIIELLTAWQTQGLPPDFYEEGVHLMMNKDSVCVFLTNSEFQTAMMNGDRLEMWHYCGNCGHEGFAEDFQLDLDNDCCNQCKEMEVRA